MALSSRNKVVAELYMLVRKEAIQFEPQDRVRIDLTTKRPDGSEIGYAVSGIAYHPDTNSLFFQLCDEDGFFVAPKGGPRSLDVLTEKQLIEVRSQVEHYVEKSMYRAKHINGISKALDELPDRSLSFPEKSFPGVMVDLNKDGHLSLEGFCSIFKAAENGEILLSGAREGVGPYNYPLNHLTDNGVSTVFNCMGRTLNMMLDKDSRQDETRQTELKPSTKVVSRKLNTGNKIL